MAEITINAKDGGSFMGYLAEPAGKPAGGVVVIQEIFGVNAVMRGITDSYAKAGYVALCPDIFWRQEPGIQITDQTEAEWARAFELFQGFDVDKGVHDLVASVDALRQHQSCNGKVGTVGFCLGGKMAFLMACRSNADCNVSYYGVGLDELLGEAGKITKPTLLHVATEDEFVPKDAQQAVRNGLKAHSHVTIHDYVGNNHAFAREGGKHYDAAAAKLAEQRTLEVFKNNLS